MSGGMIFSSGVIQLAQKTALGVAAMYGNGDAALTEASGTTFLPNLAPTSYLTSLDTDDYAALPLSLTDTQMSPTAEAEFVPIWQSSADPLDAAGVQPRPSIADISDIVSEAGEPGARITSDCKGNAVLSDLHEGLLSRNCMTQWSGYIFFDDVSQLAPKTTLCLSAMCGNRGAALTEASDTTFLPNLAPTSHSADLDTDDYSAVPSSVADPHMSPHTEAEFVPIRQSSADLPDAAGLQARPTIADISDIVSEAGDPGMDILSDAEGTEIPQLDSGLMQEALLTRGGLTLSGGYSSVEGPNVEAKISRQNIGGFGSDITASARYSKIQKLFELGYTDGNFLGSSMIFAPTLFANELSAKGFASGLGSTPLRQTARGINFHFNRKFDSGLSATANYRLSDDSFRMQGKDVVCDNGIFGSPICGAFGKTTSSILSFALTLDRREIGADNIRGFKLRLTQDLAGLGGTSRFTRTRISGEAHIGIGGDWNLSLGAKAGFMAPMGRGATPLFDRFYVSDTSMRGFDLRGMGPKVRPSAAGPGQSVAIGGRAYYSARAELSVPIGGFLGNSGLQPSVFIDAGSVFGARNTGLLPGETLLGNSAKPRVAIGIGLSLNTPMGKLRLDLARPIVKQIGDRTKTLSISFGASI